MLKKYNFKTFVDEVYPKPPKRNYPTNKKIFIHIDEIWSIDLADMIDYKFSNNKGFRYIFIIIDNFSKYVWAIPPKNKKSQTITQEFSNILTKSMRKLLETESDRGGEQYKSLSQSFLKSKKIQHYSSFTDKGPSIAERVIRSIRNLLKKPPFDKGNANWISELPSVSRKYNKTIHSSTKMTPVQASKKSNEKEVYTHLQDRRDRQQPKIKLGQLVRTPDIQQLR